MNYAPTVVERTAQYIHGFNLDGQSPQPIYASDKIPLEPVREQQRLYSSAEMRSFVEISQVSK